MCRYKRRRGRGIIAETIARRTLVSTMRFSRDSLLPFTDYRSKTCSTKGEWLDAVPAIVIGDCECRAARV